MNKQITTLLATLTLVSLCGGCSGMKNFLFGRGAACTSCASAAPVYGVTAPVEPGCGYEPSCGREPSYGLLHNQSTCNGSGTCGCGSNQSYMNSGVDQYYGEVQDPYAYNGEVIGSQVVGDNYNGYPTQGMIVPGNTIVGDGFDARGGQIYRSEPMPSTVMQP